MNPLRPIKQSLRTLKRWGFELVSYPTQHLKEVSADDYNEYWREKRGTAISYLSPWQKERADMLLACLKNDRSATIVDVGAGGASVMAYVRSHIPEATLIGVDSSELAVAGIKEQGFMAVQSVLRDAQDVESLPAADHYLFFEVLEHMPDAEGILRAAYARADKGIFFSVPNTGFFIHRLRLLGGRFPLQWNIRPGEHVRFWTLRDLRWWLKALGYRNAKISPYRGVPVLKTLWPSMFAEGIFVVLKK